MGLDSYYGKTLEQRAKDNHEAIDTEWLKENETKEMIYADGFEDMSLDSDIEELIKNERALNQVQDETLTRSVEDSLQALNNILFEIEKATTDSVENEHNYTK